MYFKGSVTFAYGKNTPPPIGRFIDPLTDFGFKRIFGSEPNKDLLIAFLNKLFKGRKVIRDLVYSPGENNGRVQYHRKTIFDLICTRADGETFIIEMQRADQKYFTDRAIYYTSGKLYEQGPKGKSNWNFKLKEVYFIGLMDFNFDNTAPGKYLHRVRLAEEESGQTFYDKLCFIFLALPNFNLDEKDLLDKWTTYCVLKTAEEKGIEKGIEKGMEKAKADEVRRLVLKLALTDARIADIAEVVM